jgi:hypothetical protein
MFDMLLATATTLQAAFAASGSAAAAAAAAAPLFFFLLLLPLQLQPLVLLMLQAPGRLLLQHRAGPVDCAATALLSYTSTSPLDILLQAFVPSWFFHVPGLLLLHPHRGGPAVCSALYMQHYCCDITDSLFWVLLDVMLL